MTRADIVEWLRQEFQPVPLATPDSTLLQLVDNAIRYWNTHSAYRSVAMVQLNDKTAEVPARMKTVVQVYPSVQSSSIFQDHPLFSLLGIVLLDNITSDLILLGEAYKTYKVYVGTDFRWIFNRGTGVDSDGNPNPGQLMVVNLPIRTDRMCVVGTRRIMANEDIDDAYILDWLLYYVKALTKMSEGNTLRKADVIGVKNDGQVLYNEGETEKKAMEERLAAEGRWVCFARRF